jgi:hypothetical protein
MARVSVDLPVSAAVARAYLSDPANRPAWQSSLRAVRDVVPGRDADPGGAGATWTDVTVVPGIRPRMRTEHADARRWSESGTCGPLRATLDLAFTDTAGGCVVSADFRVRGLGIGALVTAVSVPAIRADLERAGRLLSQGAR